jgi:two-component system, sensor histidine kinase and response regulator
MENTSRIVIVNAEDNEATRYVRSRILQRAGYVVREAINGAMTLALVAAEHPAVVLLDVKLPDIDGYEVCRRLKSNPATASSMVLQVSANFVERGDKVRGLEGGADGYLIEPVSPDELLATVRSYVRLQQAEEKLARVNLELRQQAVELRRSNEELQQFAYVVSHDLQEPLRAIGAYSELLAFRYQQEADAEVQEFVRYITEGIERMRTLMNDLLQYARVESQTKAVTLTDCHQLILQVLQDLRLSIEETGAQITCDPLPTVYADQRRLAQVLRNLLSNALKYHGPQPVRIHISASQKEGEWHFQVHDNGIGIDPQFAERIFVIFQRLHLRHEYPGTGIGLAMCKKIIEQHGGRIWVESRLGEGATFFFTLPMEHTYNA